MPELTTPDPTTIARRSSTVPANAIALPSTIAATETVAIAGEPNAGCDDNGIASR